MGSAGIEEAQLHAGGVIAEQREVHARAVPGGAERVGAARPGPEGVGPHLAAAEPIGSVRRSSHGGLRPRRSRLSITRRGEPQSHHVTPVRVVTREHPGQVLQDVAREIGARKRQRSPAGGHRGARRVRAAWTRRLSPAWRSGRRRRPASTSVLAFPTNTKVFHDAPASRHARATSGDGFSTKRRTARTGAAAARPSMGPGSIHPYSVSGAVAGHREQHDALRMLVHEGGGLRYLAHERGLLQDEVIRGEHGHDGVRRAMADPVHGQQHARGRSAVHRLEEHGRAVTGHRRRQVALHALSAPMTTVRSGWDGAARSIQGPLEKGTGARQRDILLGALVAADDARQRPKANAFTAGEDQTPHSPVQAS